MKPRFLLATLLTLVFAASSLQAGPIFTFNAAPTPGQGSSNGDVYVSGLNVFSGTMYSGPPYYGIEGNSTPLNSGTVLSEYLAAFSVNGQTGSFEIFNGASYDFTGTVVTSGVSTSGGGFVVDGYLSTSAAAYFGVSSTTLMVGTASLYNFTPAASGAPHAYSGYLQFAFSPAVTSVPEPASLVLLGTGVLGLVAFGLRRPRRSRLARDHA